MSDRYRISGASTGCGTVPADDLHLGRPVELAAFSVAPGAAQSTAAVLARITAVHHPVVAAVLDADLTEERVLVAWPAAIGASIGSRGEPVAAVLDALAQVADALDEVHQLGLAHGTLDAAVVELRPGTRAPVARIRRLGLLSLSATAASRHDPASAVGDRVALAAVARDALVPASADPAGRIARLGPPVERAPHATLPPEAVALLDSAALRPAAAPSCTALVTTLRQLLRA
jgi:hypothetical protein